MLPKLKTGKGFTLIELLVVIAILSILLVIVLVAINPARQTRDARNSKRRADVLTVLNAVNQHFVEEDGAFPSGTPAAGSSAAVSAAGVTDTFCTDLVPDYVAALPVDPSLGSDTTGCGGAWDTGYTISRSVDGDRITITAPDTEQIATISATR
ncbi:MAG: type II secretion system protein [Candidatus Woykebacteria bacterium]